jgi:hypothetical protein
MGKINRKATLEHSGQVLEYVHSKLDCMGPSCTLHKMSSHHLRSWPQRWNPQVIAMERVCEHGVGHTDPDEINQDIVVSIDHSEKCDGCCIQAG